MHGYFICIRLGEVSAILVFSVRPCLSMFTMYRTLRRRFGIVTETICRASSSLAGLLTQDCNVGIKPCMYIEYIICKHVLSLKTTIVLLNINLFSFGLNYKTPYIMLQTSSIV